MSKREQVHEYAEKKLNYLENIATKDETKSESKRIMANLRRGIGKQIGEVPELWKIVFYKIEDELAGKDKISYAEWAIYTTLTLYALHQQGKDIEGNNMNQKYMSLGDAVSDADTQNLSKISISLGRAAAHLVESEDDIDRILKRLNLVVTAVSPEDLAYHLRGIIQLLKQKDIPLDYANLAADLYQFHYEESAEFVKCKWGRDFWYEHYRLTNKNKENNEKENQE